VDEKQIFSKTLKKFPTLFGGGLGMLNKTGIYIMGP
jgi:hypothetical protein